MELDKQDVSFLIEEYYNEFQTLTERKCFPRVIDDLDIELFIKSLTKENNIITYVVNILTPRLKFQLENIFINYKSDICREFVDKYIDRFLGVHWFRQPEGFEFANDILNESPKYYINLGDNEAVIINDEYPFEISDILNNLDEILIFKNDEIKSELIKNIF